MAVYLYIALTVLGTVAGQLLMKKGMLQVGKVPSAVSDLPEFFFKAFANPYVVTSLGLAVIAAMAWMAAVSKSELSYVYPFMSLAFALVLVLSGVFYDEQISIMRFVGVGIICVGVVVVARS